MDSCLRGKRFFGRSWLCAKLLRLLHRRPTGALPGVMMSGGAGSGKSAFCAELVWPAADLPIDSPQAQLRDRLLAFHFCQQHRRRSSLSPVRFVLSLLRQIVASPLLPEDLRSSLLEQNDDFSAALCDETDDAAALLTDPEDAFLRLLSHLRSVELSTPLLLLVDSLDECDPIRRLVGTNAPACPSILELLGRHHKSLPSWLLLVCTARRTCVSANHLLAGFRRVLLDAFDKPNIRSDLQQYICHRIDYDENLRDALLLRPNSAQLLHTLHIKSEGCVLYLERILDGIADGFLLLDEVHDIPGTLNGLYLWLCQRLYPDKQTFDAIRPLLNSLLASPKPLSIDDLFECLCATDTEVTREDFDCIHLPLLARIIAPAAADEALAASPLAMLFHNSFAEWLLDVKHCTRRYFCDARSGMRNLAAWHTDHPDNVQSLSDAVEVAQCVANAKMEKELNSWEITLWYLWACEHDTDAIGGLTAELDAKTLTLLTTAGNDMCPLDRKSEASSSTPCTPLHCGFDSSQLQSDENRLDEVFDTLLRAAREGNCLLLERLLGAVDHSLHPRLLNRTDADGWSALRGAAWAGHTAAVDVLLRARADVEFADETGRTALRAAAWAGHEDIVARLISSGADPNRADTQGHTPLMAAAYMQHGSIVRQLIKDGANVEQCDSERRTALALAVLHAAHSGEPVDSQLSLVNDLLEASPSTVDSVDSSGYTALLHASSRGATTLCELLLNHGADVDYRHTETALTPLLAAATGGYRDTIEALLSAGGDIDAIDVQGRTVLSLAAEANAVDLVELLLKERLDELHRDNRGWIALHYASCEGHTKVAEVLLKHNKATVADCDTEGRHPLLLACFEGFHETAALLIDNGAPIDQASHDGRTALCSVLTASNRDLAHLLASRGASLTVKCPDGRPILHQLVLDHRLPMLQFLLSQGASPDCRDENGRTPMHIAAYLGDTDSLETLLRWNADVNAPDNASRTPLTTATWQSQVGAMAKLLTAGARSSAASREGATPLHVAGQLGCEAAVHELLRCGADCKLRDNYGRTPAAVALQAGFPVLAKLLAASGAATTTDYDSALGTSLSGGSGGSKSSGRASAYEIDTLSPRHKNRISVRPGLSSISPPGKDSNHSPVKFGTHTSSLSNYTVSSCCSNDSQSQVPESTTTSFTMFSRALLDRSDSASKKAKRRSQLYAVSANGTTVFEIAQNTVDEIPQDTSQTTTTSTTTLQDAPELKRERTRILTNPRCRPGGKATDSTSSLCSTGSMAR